MVYESKHWWYVGEDGHTHGPFTSIRMRELVESGAFLEDTLCKDEQQMIDYAELAAIYPTPDDAFEVPPTVPAGLKATQLQKKLAAGMAGDRRWSGLSALDVYVDTDDDQYFVPHVNIWPNEARYGTWYYIAPDGKPHGPYGSPQMRAWFDQEYFDPYQLQLRHVQTMPPDQFLPLPCFFPDIETAFYTIPKEPAVDDFQDLNKNLHIVADEETRDPVEGVFKMSAIVPMGIGLGIIGLITLIVGILTA